MRRKSKRHNMVPMMICLMLAMVISTTFVVKNVYFANENTVEEQPTKHQTQTNSDMNHVNQNPGVHNLVFTSSKVDFNNHLKLLMSTNNVVNNSNDQIPENEVIDNSVEIEIPEVETPTEDIVESTTPADGYKIHVIKTGDSYWEIAIKYYGRGHYCYAMAEYNGINTNTILHAGDELIIPSLDDPEFKKLITGITYNAYPDKESVELSYSDTNEYKYGKRMRPAVDINIPSEGESMKNYTGEVDTSNFTYWGECKITGYTPGCAHCCGGSTAGIGSSGVSCIPGYSVAMGSAIPFGTTIYIEGYGFYVVEDRGVGNYHVDISAPSHEACYDLTKLGVNVWIVE